MANKKVKIKYKNVFIALAALAVIVLAVLAIAGVFSPKGDKNTDEPAASTDANVTDAPVTEPEGIVLTTDPAKQSSYIFDSVLKSAGDVHLGNLVLVNNNIEYKGNVQEKDLLVVREHKNSSYWVKDYSVLVSPILMDSLNAMLEDFEEATGNSHIMVRAGHRTVEYQSNLYQSELDKTGAVDSTLVAKPGFSEHHTALACDFTTYKNQVFEDFTGQGDYAWILENCHKYGLVNRYPVGKERLTLIDYEPWHFRYVGYPHAEVMYEYGFCLEEYISFIKNYTVDSGFLVFNTQSGEQYLIYYTPLLEGGQTPVYLPTVDGENLYPYEISGNNVDGFIVTVKLK